MSNCYLKQKKYDQAVEYVDNTLDLISKINGDNSKQFAFTNVLKSKIHAENNALLKGIEEIKQSIAILININYHNK